jgi:signal transduction histidine kinase
VLVSAASAAVFALLYLATGPTAFVAPNLLGSGLLALVAADRGRHPVAQVYAAVGIALVLFGFELGLIGHVDNGITIWFIVPNVAVMLLGMRRAATLCAITTVAEVAAVAIASWAHLLSSVATLPNPDLIMVMSLVGVLCVCGVLAWLVYRSRVGLLAEVQTQNAALNEALNEAHEARNEAVEASLAKDRFFANLTHEIRTPLTGIAGSAELLADGNFTGEQRMLADGLLASTRSLTTLVNAMLDHARLAAHRTTLEVAPVGTSQLAADLERLYRPVAEERALALAVVAAERVPVRIETDGIRLRQVLANLVSNALKFTERGSVRVAFDWEPGEAAAGTFIAAVADTGPGIDPDLQAAIFEPFVQGDASIARRHPGTGLGLAISRQLAELLGGTIELSSRLGSGSTFTVRIPATALPALAAEPSRPRPPADEAADPARAAPPPPPRPDDRDPLAGLRVLLVEDNPMNRAVATAMLRRAGAEVVAATGGAEAVGLAASTALDLVLMDLQMPGMDGIEATRRIRAAEATRGRQRLPILAMTGNAFEDYGEACADAGMDGFVTKPVTAVQLRGLVARAVAQP